MGLVEQWRRIRAELPSGWSEAHVAVTVPHADRRARAAALLGPASPGLSGEHLRFAVNRSGAGVGPERVETLFRKLDEERIGAAVTLLDTLERAPREEAPRGSLAEAWGKELDTLPADWSELLAELTLMSSDHLAGAALLLAPVNPTKVPDRLTLRFRVASRFGYGASPEMTVRCFQRLDEAGIPGRLTVMHVQSDTHPVATQGSVWRVGGKAV